MEQMKDGFDYLTLGQLSRKWDTVSTLGGAALATGIYGRGKAMFGINKLGKNIPSYSGIGYQGFHIFVPSGSPTVDLCFWADGVTNQVTLRLWAGNQFQFLRNGTGIGALSAPVAGGTWYWIVGGVKVHNTAGVAMLRINNVDTLNIGVSNLNTRATSNSFFNIVGPSPGASGFGVDNYHYWDDSGSFNNGWRGERVILTGLANRAGSSADWTRDGTTINAANYQQVNEANPDDDATFNRSNTPGNLDSYGYPPLTGIPGASVIDSIAINTVDRVDDASPHTIKHYAKSGGSSVLVPTAGITYSGSVFMNHQTIIETDPATGAQPTVSAYNLMEFGVELIS